MADSICNLDGCVAPVYVKSRGWCRRHYRRWWATGSPHAPEALTCETCGQQFTRAATFGPTPRFCSRACRPRGRRPARPVEYRTCPYCGDQFEATSWNRRFCATKCRDAFHRYGGKPVPQRACYVCGATLDYLTIRPSGYRLKRSARKCFTCRRDQRYEMTVEQLALRDGPHCSLCGDVVDLATEWPDPASPTRDHVVPYSLGGDNSAENLALAHFACNIRKGNRYQSAT